MSLPLKIIDEIHGRLLIRYGAKWFNLWAGIDAASVKLDWSAVLANVTPDGVQSALENLPTDAPPNAAQFKALCLRQAPPMYVHALPGPPPDPARVKQALGGLQLSSTNIPQRAVEWRQRLYHLRDTGRASRHHLDAIAQIESTGRAETTSAIGDFSPIDINLWPPGMRADATAQG